MSINKVVLSGYLTRDPELKNSTSGTAVLSFGIAVNERRKNSRTGEWEDVPNFFDCTMFGTRAEAISRFIAKGTKAAIEGRLRYSSWERDGQRRSKVDVIVDEIEFLSRQNDSQQATQAAPRQPQRAQTAPRPAPAPPQDAYYEDDDIPF
ncbi:MAG: single-stranded DNA-binding protein [Atopobium sp.]|uniref:single-stranded DNA-binding protein n=1 Tax=Atopobium sp. TaxID=1872650 RepID=UPI002A831508|nr:single-stranded DNA-binding protein [Atopobium sp.]MDY4523084.1 single-stranded DNA-binding protein [Atopobium sp.]